MNIKIALGILAVILVVGGGYWYWQTNIRQTSSIQEPETSTWKTYENQDLGFSIKYPPLYSLTTADVNIHPEWRQMQFLTISSPADNTSTYEFHVLPLQIVLQKQPIVYDGQSYHTISEARKAGLYTDGNIVSISSTEVVYEAPSPDAGAEDAPMAHYIFIKNDLVYWISVKVDDPYAEKMLQSIQFKPAKPRS